MLVFDKKTTQFCKAIIPQLKNKLKKEKPFPEKNRPSALFDLILS